MFPPAPAKFSVIALPGVLAPTLLLSFLLSLCSLCSVLCDRRLPRPAGCYRPSSSRQSPFLLRPLCYLCVKAFAFLFSVNSVSGVYPDLVGAPSALSLVSFFLCGLGGSGSARFSLPRQIMARLPTSSSRPEQRRLLPLRSGGIAAQTSGLGSCSVFRLSLFDLRFLLPDR